MKTVITVLCRVLCLGALPRVACLLLAVAATGLDARGAIIHTMPYGVGDLDYNPETHRVAWWSGVGRCNVEIPNPATVSLSSTYGLQFRRDDVGMACEGGIESLVTDDGYVYFSQGGWLWRLALGAPVRQAATQLPLGVSAGFTPTAVTRFGDWLYWVESNGTFCKLWKADGAGTGQQQLVQTGNWGVIRKLRVFYGPATISTLYCCMLSENGQIWKGAVSPAGTFSVLVDRAVDFDLRVEGGGGQVLPFYRIFAAQSKQLLAVHYGSGASTVLYSAPDDKTLASVAVDDRRVYVIQKFSITCGDGLFTCPAYNVLRQERPLHDFTLRLWENIDYEFDNQVTAPHSLRAADKYLIWADGRTIRSISSDAPPLFLNFFAMGLEIVQTIQDLNNSVPLVQGKPTYVRAYARTDFNTTGKSAFFPNGVLKVAARLSPEVLLPLGTLNPIRMPAVGDGNDLQTLRSDGSKSYLFELPQGWTRYPQLFCEFTVNSDRAFSENVGFDPYGDNAVAGLAQFHATAKQCWVFVSVKTDPQTYDVQVERSTSDFWRIIDRARTLLPVDQVQVETWADKIGPIGSTGDAKFVLKSQADWDHALGALAAWTVFRYRPCPCTRYIGAVHPKAGMGSSVAGIGYKPPLFANSVVVKMDPGCGASWNCPKGGTTLAHELGHNYGREHVNCGNPKDIDSSYPYPPCTITIPNLKDRAAHYGFDPISFNVIDPGANADLMSYGNPKWISDYTWRGILFSGQSPCYGSGGGGGGGGADFRMAAAGAADENLLIMSGTITPGTRRVELFPGYVLPPGVVDDAFVAATMAAGASGLGSDYLLRLVGNQGNTLIEVPVQLQLSDSHEDVTVGGFVQALPFPQEAEASVQSVQVVHNGQVRAQRYFSAHAPMISLAPLRLDALQQVLECDWIASDADGDRLTFTVQYSSDNGATWIPVQVAYPGSSLRLDTRSLAGGLQSRVRVIASDGLRSTLATSDPFIVPNNGPTAVIVGLREGDRVPFGSLNPVTGLAHDTEEGLLDPALFTWTISGPSSGAQRGERLSLVDLAPGSYQTTLRVTDTGGLTSSNSVHFEVLPMEVPDRPAPEIDGLCADDAYVNALQIRFASGSAQPAYARLSHGDGYLHVALTGLPFSSQPDAPLSIGVVIDANASRSARPEAGDLGFYVDETGLPSQRNGDGTDLVPNLLPNLGVQTAVARGEGSWSAELKIPDTLLGGWSHEAGLLIHLRDEPGTVGLTWPAAAAPDNPASWARVLFGSNPTPSNQPPVAVASAPRVVELLAPQDITLNGEQSFDPDGCPLAYHWTQVAGPAVTLRESESATPVFTVTPTPATSPITLRFRLVVNDGDLDSVGSEVDCTMYSSALIPQPLPPIHVDTTQARPGPVQGALEWSGIIGDRCVIEASEDLIHWTPIRTNTVDWDGRVHFRDTDTASHPWRFYRAHGLTSSTFSVYRNDFESTVNTEWSPRQPLDSTPLGGRKFLGQFGTEVISLTLGDLPAHTRIRFSCDLFVIGSWDGNSPEGGADRWQLQVRNGPTLLNATFSTYWEQSYPGDLSRSFPARTGSIENDTLGYALPGFGGGDSVYHLTFEIDHFDSTLVLDFDASGLTTRGDETWGLDNVVIEAVDNP